MYHRRPEASRDAARGSRAAGASRWIGAGRGCDSSAEAIAPGLAVTPALRANPVGAAMLPTSDGGFFPHRSLP